MPNIDKAIEFAHEQRTRFLEELGELIAIPSISADSAYDKDIQRAAEWLSAKLKSLGFDKVQIMPTEGHPLVYGEYMKAGKDAATMMVYGHYDVQPADPVELWESEPFKATIRGEGLYARGSSDMKGQVIASMAAVESVLQNGDSPVNIKYFLEGEDSNMKVFGRSYRAIMPTCRN